MSLIVVTDKAKDAIIKLLDSTPENPIGIRISIKTKGCSGLAWDFEIARSVNEYDDKVIINDRYMLYIDKKATLFILGSTLDYVTTDLESGFVFNNPNEKGKCGCGESFYV